MSTEPGGSKAILHDRYVVVRAATEALCVPLAVEDYVAQSMPDASPAKWHLAHTTWFFETFVLKLLPGFRPFQALYEHLFNSYYHSVGTPFVRAQRGVLTRPTVEEVYEYRRHVDGQLRALIESDRLDARLTEIVELGLQHEQQHQELLLTDLKNLLALNPLRPAYREGGAVVTKQAPSPRWLRYEGGLHEVGAGAVGFAFDNERPRHQVHLVPYELASRSITNAEFQEFIAAGGYRRADLWLADAWATVSNEGWQAPLYWEQNGSAWQHFTLQGMRPVDPAAPVCHISYYEADAFARWSGARLPTEAEWEVAAAAQPVDGNFVETGLLQPRAASGPAPTSPVQLFGDVWEWTQSPYVAYPGYQPPVGALGEYNGKFMCNQMVLRGGSCVTPATHVRASYRNFFPPQARWQFSGLRLARDAAD